MTETHSAGRQKPSQTVTRLRSLASEITTATSSTSDKPSPPAPVVLALAGRGFSVGGVVSELLDQYALPRRDNFAVCVHYCVQALAVLRRELGLPLMRRYSDGVSDAELRKLADTVENELLDSTPEDIEPIAAALISLGAAMHDAIVPLIENPDLSLKIRNAARVTAEAAETLRNHYGGDGGGW